MRSSIIHYQSSVHDNHNNLYPPPPAPFSSRPDNASSMANKSSKSQHVPSRCSPVFPSLTLSLSFRTIDLPRASSIPRHPPLEHKHKAINPTCSTGISSSTAKIRCHPSSSSIHHYHPSFLITHRSRTLAKRPYPSISRSLRIPRFHENSSRRTSTVPNRSSSTRTSHAHRIHPISPFKPTLRRPRRNSPTKSITPSPLAIPIRTATPKSNIQLTSEPPLRQTRPIADLFLFCFRSINISLYMHTSPREMCVFSSCQTRH